MHEGPPSSCTSLRPVRENAQPLEHGSLVMMQLELTDRAADVIRRKGGTAVVDLLEPFG